MHGHAVSPPAREVITVGEAMAMTEVADSPPLLETDVTAAEEVAAVRMDVFVATEVIVTGMADEVRVTTVSIPVDSPGIVITLVRV